MLACRQEGHTREDGGVPERYLAFPQSLDNEGFPGVVLQQQIAQQFIVRDADSHLIGEREPRLEGIEIVERYESPTAEGYGPEDKQWQGQENQDYEEVK